MPPKRKDSATTPAASGPKQKRSKTSFRTPTTAGLESIEAASSEVPVASTKNRVVTLRASASGRRGYRSQDLSAGPSSSLASGSSAAEDLVLSSGDIPSTSYSIPSPNLESDIPPSFDSGTKARPKKKNTTTVR